MFNQGRRVGQTFYCGCILEPKWHKTQDAPTTKPPTNQTVGFSICAVLCLARWRWDDADGDIIFDRSGLIQGCAPAECKPYVGLWSQARWPPKCEHEISFDLWSWREPWVSAYVTINVNINVGVNLNVIGKCKCQCKCKCKCKYKCKCNCTCTRTCRCTRNCNWNVILNVM